jgi:hypothetical protein
MAHDPDPTTDDVRSLTDVENTDGVDKHVDGADAAEHETEHHATTGGAAAVGAVTGGVVGLAGGPLGAAVGAIGGALIGVAAERIMHHEEDAWPVEGEPEDVASESPEEPQAE